MVTTFTWLTSRGYMVSTHQFTLSKYYTHFIPNFKETEESVPVMFVLTLSGVEELDTRIAVGVITVVVELIMWNTEC
jgi:hypothetical protein